MEFYLESIFPLVRIRFQAQIYWQMQYKLCTLIGIATGEYTNDYGEQVYFQLPNSKATVYVSSTYDIGANGDPEKFEPVHPDIKVSENVLEFAIEWMRE